MSKMLLLVRHGESESNAVGGHATVNPDRLQLTALGRHQAATMATSLTWPPDAPQLEFWVSPLSRAMDTLAYVVQRYPQANVTPVPEAVEFTPFRLPVPTTREQRAPLVRAYYERGNPLEVGAQGESFLEFYQRVARLLADAVQQEPDMIVCHGGTICMLGLLLDPDFLRLEMADAMAAFRKSTESGGVGNCEIVAIQPNTKNGRPNGHK